MHDDQTVPGGDSPGLPASGVSHGNPSDADASDAGRPPLPAAARRALVEAEARRRSLGAAVRPAEHGGRDGPDPVRYGDWEKKGIAIDF